MAGTHEDAALVVELAKLGAMNGLGEAVGKIFADDFDPTQPSSATRRFASSSAGTRPWRRW